jgi:hypothetical protein
VKHLERADHGKHWPGLLLLLQHRSSHGASATNLIAEHSLIILMRRPGHLSHACRDELPRGHPEGARLQASWAEGNAANAMALGRTLQGCNTPAAHVQCHAAVMGRSVYECVGAVKQNLNVCNRNVQSITRTQYQLTVTKARLQGLYTMASRDVVLRRDHRDV